MTPNVKDYTTEELERLTTLHEQCSQVQMGEYVCFCQPEIYLRICQPEIYLRTEAALARMGSLVRSNGAHALLSATSCDLIRRVRSFTDPTELDPPQEAMLAELKRRKEPPISNKTHAGRRVRHVFNGKTGIVASTSLRAAMDAYWPSTADDEVAWVCDAGRAQGCCASQLELLHD